MDGDEIVTTQRSGASPPLTADHRLAPAEATTSGEPAPEPGSGHKPVSHFAAQEAEILASLRKHGHDPTALPRNPSGRPGVKAATRHALGNKGMWARDRVFDKAWERLRKNKDVVYKD